MRNDRIDAIRTVLGFGFLAAILSVPMQRGAGAAEPPEVAPPPAPPAEAPAPTPAAARPLRELPIVEVVVYEDRALVTREGDVPVAGAVETIVIGGLPPDLQETSLRAGLAGIQGRVISVTSEVERRREIQDAKLRAADEKSRAAARRIAAVQDDIARVAVQEAYLDAYEKLTVKALSERTGGLVEPGTERWAEALRFLREARAEAQARKREADRQRDALSQEHSDLHAEAERLRRPEERSVRNAEVSLECKEAGTAKLRLSYVIPGARWAPRYDARFEAATGDLDVTCFGEVSQRTGEDWKAARLVLSTARPSVGASRPRIIPLRLESRPVVGGAKGKGIAILEKPAGGDALGLVREGEEGARTAGEPARPASPGLATAEAREGATAATFTVPGQATIPTDGRPYKVPITGFRDRPAMSFETVPKLQRFVYLKCSARNVAPHPLLAGPVDIYRGGGFIGTAALQFTAPGRPFDLSLGIEESLKVRRAVTAQAWTADHREKREGFDIEVTNFGEKAQGVLVLDGFPVSDIEEVTVRLDGSTTQATEKDEKTGILKWRLTLQPGEAKTVHLEYTVRYPKGYLGG